MSNVLVINSMESVCTRRSFQSSSAVIVAFRHSNFAILLNSFVCHRCRCINNKNQSMKQILIATIFDIPRIQIQQQVHAERSRSEASTISLQIETNSKKTREAKNAGCRRDILLFYLTTASLHSFTFVISFFLSLLHHVRRFSSHILTEMVYISGRFFCNSVFHNTRIICARVWINTIWWIFL